MITVQAEILFRVDTQADADRILLAIADLVIPEVDGSIGATTTPNPPVWPEEPGPWQHPHMEGR